MWLMPGKEERVGGSFQSSTSHDSLASTRLVFPRFPCATEQHPFTSFPSNPSTARPPHRRSGLQKSKRVEAWNRRQCGQAACNASSPGLRNRIGRLPFQQAGVPPRRLSTPRRAGIGREKKAPKEFCFKNRQAGKFPNPIASSFSGRFPKRNLCQRKVADRSWPCRPRCEFASQAVDRIGWEHVSADGRKKKNEGLSVQVA